MLPHDSADPGQLRPEGLIGGDDMVETVGDLTGHARPLEGHSGGEIPCFDLGQDAQQNFGIDRVGGSNLSVYHRNLQGKVVKALETVWSVPS